MSGMDQNLGRWINALLEIADRAVDEEPALKISGYPSTGFCVQVTPTLYGRGDTLLQAVSACAVQVYTAVQDRAAGDRAALREFKPVLAELLVASEHEVAGRQLSLPLDHVVPVAEPD